VQAARALYRDLSATLGLHRLTCIEGSGIGLVMTRLYGRAAWGERALGRAPRNCGQHVTRLGALACTGLEAVMTVEGAPDADVFRACVQEGLCPTRHEGGVVVAGNLSAHQAAGVREAIAATGARLLCLPPYSPDLNPIEQCRSQTKTCLRAAQACPRGALDEAVTRALATSTEAGAQAWFAHCGYALH
jgi:transposase